MPMATTIGSSFSSSPSSPFRYFQHSTNAKFRLSQFPNQQGVAHLRISDKDKSYEHIHGVQKLRARLVVGSDEDQSQISGLQRAPQDIFPIGNSCFHVSQNGGKPVVSFCNRPFSGDNEVISSNSERTWNKISWFIGPAVLVASFGFPLICLPDILCRIFGDRVLSVYFQSFSQEAIFYCGVVVFLLLLDRLMRAKQVDHPSANNSDTLTLQLGWEIFLSVVTTMLRHLSITIPMVTVALIWPWNGHVIPVTLIPYLVGIFVQFAFEFLALTWKSPSWAAVPFIFHVYRLHQIQKATHRLTYLLFDLARAEKAGTVYNNLPVTRITWSTLRAVLQVLLVVWIWSFLTFLLKFLSSTSATKSDAEYL